MGGISGKLSFDRDDLIGAVSANERGDVCAASDSAITNARHLREQLERRGHCFRTDEESELVAHAYEEWDLRCVDHLHGAFACAVWDARRRRLLLVRDRVGIRPLYFTLSGGGVAFASDIRTLLEDPDVGREWSPDAVDAYLALGHVPAPLTAYRRISKLEPAQRLIAEGRRLRVEPYWDLPSTTTQATLEERITALEELLRAAVRHQVAACGTTGVLYSGGIASSALLAMAPREVEPAVTVHLEQDGSELTRSDAAASHLGRTRELEVVRSNPAALAVELAGHCDGPNADPSAIAQFAIYRLARRHMDAAAAAHGAGVLWAGNGGHAVDRITNGLWHDQYRRGLYTRGFAWQVRDANPFQRQRELYSAHHSRERGLYVDARTFLPDGIVASATNAARAARLEVRFPYLDEELVILAATTPGAFRQQRRPRRHALRQLLLRQMSPALMPPIRHRPAPHLWLRTAVRSMVPDLLFAARFDGRGIVSRPALYRLWEEHCSRRRDHAYRLWSLVMLELWFRTWVDGDAAAEPLEYAVLKAVA